ncbi:hypothetical protein ACH5RR_031748 [Cinchona calisaya]|uniref:F-box associated beta-propeller type 3 domain-containing protein n=1 Tax=Cinchona calisaya TaxID=153742 RepID=A0ABD2YI28_9GENT
MACINLQPAIHRKPSSHFNQRKPIQALLNDLAIPEHDAFDSSKEIPGDCSLNIIGSCNGLICIAFEDGEVYLWNPSTRKSRKLPGIVFEIGKPPPRYVANGSRHVEAYDEYKVVKIFSANAVYVYSSNTESWRKIPDFQGGYPRSFPRTVVGDKFLNGKLHWMTEIVFDSYRCGIVSLDLTDETYKEVDQIYRSSKRKYSSISMIPTLGLLGGCLNVDSELWIMKEYGMRESWTKMGVIPLNRRPFQPYPCVIPLCISENGEVLILYDMMVLLYNPKDKSIRHRRFCDMT